MQLDDSVIYLKNMKIATSVRAKCRLVLYTGWFILSSENEIMICTKGSEKLNREKKTFQIRWCFISCYQ